MADGLFDFNRAEQIQQANIAREKVIVVSTSDDTYEGAANSAYASVDPNNTAQGIPDQLGPHFVLSGRTSDGSPHTYGFAVVFFTVGLNTAGPVAAPPEEGFDVTVWVLQSNLQIPGLPPDQRQIWASLGTVSGVQMFERWHTFDVNACAVRFQIEGMDTDGLIGIALTEM